MWRRRTKLLDDLKERTGYSHLKEEVLDPTMWRARFGRGFGPVVRQTTEWMKLFCPNDNGATQTVHVIYNRTLLQSSSRTQIPGQGLKLSHLKWADKSANHSNVNLNKYTFWCIHTVSPLSKWYLIPSLVAGPSLTTLLVYRSVSVPSRAPRAHSVCNLPHLCLAARTYK